MAGLSLKKLAQQVKKEQKDKDRTVEELFTAAIDEFIMQRTEARANSKTHRKAHNPSSYYKCMRMKWYELMDYPSKRKTTPKQQRVFDVGTITHEWVQDEVLAEMDKREDSPLRLIPYTELPAFQDEQIEFIREHNSSPIEIKFLDWRFTKLFPISAMVDGAFRFAGKDILFEFKTINSKDFEYLIEPSMDYRKQGAIYSTCLGVRFVMFLYINKDNQEWKAFLVEYTDEQHQWVKDRIQTLEMYVETKTLPPKEASDNCRWCAFKSLCDKEVGAPEVNF
jgi:CRISPR/Cas system-associated exonuclease Cas4 (RecB family)